MTPKQHHEMRQIIESLIKEIHQELEASADASKTAVTPDSAIGRISRVEAM